MANKRRADKIVNIHVDIATKAIARIDRRSSRKELEQATILLKQLSLPPKCEIEETASSYKQALNRAHRDMRNPKIGLQIASRRIGAAQKKCQEVELVPPDATQVKVIGKWPPDTSIFNLAGTVRKKEIKSGAGRFRRGITMGVIGRWPPEPIKSK